MKFRIPRWLRRRRPAPVSIAVVPATHDNLFLASVHFSEHYGGPAHWEMGLEQYVRIANALMRERPNYLVEYPDTAHPWLVNRPVIVTETDKVKLVAE